LKVSLFLYQFSRFYISVHFFYISDARTIRYAPMILYSRFSLSHLHVCCIAHLMTSGATLEEFDSSADAQFS
jgi:hypothetical protein